MWVWNQYFRVKQILAKTPYCAVGIKAVHLLTHYFLEEGYTYKFSFKFHLKFFKLDNMEVLYFIPF